MSVFHWLKAQDLPGLPDMLLFCGDFVHHPDGCSRTQVLDRLNTQVPLSEIIDGARFCPCVYRDTGTLDVDRFQVAAGALRSVGTFLDGLQADERCASYPALAGRHVDMVRHLFDRDRPRANGMTRSHVSVYDCPVLESIRLGLAERWDTYQRSFPSDPERLRDEMIRFAAGEVLAEVDWNISDPLVRIAFTHLVRCWCAAGMNVPFHRFASEHGQNLDHWMRVTGASIPDGTFDSLDRRAAELLERSSEVLAMGSESGLRTSHASGSFDLELFDVRRDVIWASVRARAGGVLLCEFPELVLDYLELSAAKAKASASLYRDPIGPLPPGGSVEPLGSADGFTVEMLETAMTLAVDGGMTGTGDKEILQEALHVARLV